MIETVKEQRNENNELIGYLVNEKLSVPIADGNKDYKEVKEWLKTNTLEPFMTDAELLDKAKGNKKASIEIEYISAITSNILYMDKLFQVDKESMELLAQNLSVGSVPDGFYWASLDNTRVPMTFSELQGLGSAIQARGLVAFSNKRDKKDLVDSVQLSDIEPVVTLEDALTTIESI